MEMPKGGIMEVGVKRVVITGGTGFIGSWLVKELTEKPRIYINNAFTKCVLCNRSRRTYAIGSGVFKPLKEYIIEIRDIIDPKLELGIGDIPSLSRLPSP